MRFTLSSNFPRNPIPQTLREDMHDLNLLGEKFDETDGWDESHDGDGVYNFRGWADACTQMIL